jgi:RNA polymerase sigma factor (sigma-70 family)
VTNLADTRNSLLLRLPNRQDIEAWDMFVAIYEPLVFRLARSKGLQEADAKDFVQEVLLSVSRAIHRWNPDPAKGRFRDWLFRIARNLMINFLTRRKHQSIAYDGPVENWLELQVDPATQSVEIDIFDLEYRREVFWLAADQVRTQVQPKTWEAFWLVAVQNDEPEIAAKKLNLSKGAVVVAKCRVIARLRDVIKQMEIGHE